MAAIDIAGVSKTFGSHVAVDDLSLGVPRRLDLRLHRAQRLGQDDDDPDDHEHPPAGSRRDRRARPRRYRPRRATTSATCPRSAASTSKMKVRRLLRYFGALKGGTAADLDARDRRSGSSGSTSRSGRDKQIDALSKGMAQKVQFIAAVIAEPKLLILDEPFSGLDPVNADVLRDAVLELRRRGTTIVFSHARHGRRRAAVRSHLHDLQGPQGARRDARRDPGALRPRHGARADRAAARPRSTALPERRVGERLRQLPGRAARRATRRRSWPALVAAHRASTTSRSRSRRCTTSSSASPSPTSMPDRSRRWADDFRAQGLDRRRHRVPARRPQQGVHHRRPADAGAGRHLGDRAEVRRRRSRQARTQGRHRRRDRPALSDAVAGRRPVERRAGGQGRHHQGPALPARRGEGRGRPPAGRRARRALEPRPREGDLRLRRTAAGPVRGRPQGALLHRQPDVPAAAAMARGGRRPPGHRRAAAQHQRRPADHAGAGPRDAARSARAADPRRRRRSSRRPRSPIRSAASSRRWC